MSAIVHLDEVTIGQIAAGEIVERPVSVVKELVENAIDAGASQITVTIEEGGLALIEVADDGEGIEPAELLVALERHATSKLRDASSLHSIATLGFRGEGLASIAAVSRLRVVSRRAQSQFGAAVDAWGEERGAVESVASPPGTRVRAQELFFNVPVRRDFLRSAPAESGRISSWLSVLALGYPEIAFRLVSDGKTIFSFPAGGDVRQRLIEVFGRSAADELLPIDVATPDMHGGVGGFISRPGFDRPTRRMQILFVNRRLLRTQALAGAWTGGYATYAMTGRHPFGVLFLNLRPQDVDVNVHPTKFDVRFRFSQQVYDVVRRAIASTLDRQAVATLQSALSLAPLLPPEPAGAAESNGTHALPFAFAAARSDAPVHEGLRVLAQLDRTFILATEGRSLVLIDQHAAHECIAFDRLKRSALEGAPSEPLLTPLALELALPHAAQLERAFETLQRAGFEIEHFGERAFRVLATPAGYGHRHLELTDLLEELDEPNGPLDARERIWASLACHSVTRAGDRLEMVEMNALLEALHAAGNPMHCPHGRPTFVRFEPVDIARLFKRI